MKKLQKTDFYYHLPQNLIAQTPISPRNHSRMMVLSRETGDVSHHKFFELKNFLKKGDCLILNDSRVLPARLYGKRKDTGGEVEFLLLHTSGNDLWEVLAGPGKKAKVGNVIQFGDGLLEAEVIEIVEEGNRLVKFSYDDCGGEKNLYNILDEIGEMPLPHYITEKLKDNERYQTVYNREIGSAAAPTAGLHFTVEQLDELLAEGINIGYVTLHVGLGTFRPVKAESITEHQMHSEHYEISKATAKLVNDTKKSGERVIAVGTTSCRTLESAEFSDGEIMPSNGWTDIFIYPDKENFKFNVIDGLITNFHLPESTLIMLVSAFAGYENTMNAYKLAVEEEYRFFSFGDSMIII